jgi:predicted ester cyclase
MIMSVEENKALIRRYFSPTPSPEAIRRIREAKDPSGEGARLFRSLFESVFAPGYVGHDSTGDMDREQALQMNLELVAAFPGSSWGMDRMVAEGDLVVVLGKMLGTHKGPYKGTPATGKKVEVAYTVTYRIADGRVVEAWSSMDWLGLMQQIGAIPSGPPKN